MAFSRAGYRLKQMWSALWARPAAGQLAAAKQFLNDSQYKLFQTMQPSEQAHALAVFTQLRAQGYADPDLLAAALLHDVGKTRIPLRPGERALVVLGKRFLPRQTAQWGAGGADGWRRSFVVAARHPQWGAALAEASGASPRAVDLIRRHQDVIHTDFEEEETRLLAALQAVDDNN